jgi:hypothetical protein
MSIDWRKRPDTVLLEDRPGPLKDSSVEESLLVSTGEKGFTALIRAMTARINEYPTTTGSAYHADPA